MSNLKCGNRVLIECLVVKKTRFSDDSILYQLEAVGNTPQGKQHIYLYEQDIKWHREDEI